MPDSPTTSTSLLSVAIGANPRGSGGVWSLGLPVLRGPVLESLFPEAREFPPACGFALFRAEARLIGIASIDPGDGLELATRDLYRALIEQTTGWHLCRIWNYVPDINGGGRGGLENYRAFSAGRSVAFEAALGEGFKLRLPAASAVGSGDSRLSVVFVASAEPVSHWENALQVPAYDYPGDYGPRAPSFARGTTVPASDGRRDVFISGTAAIRGHQTVAPGDTAAQLQCTVGNLREISQACGLGADLGGAHVGARHAKVYLRHACDLDRVAAQLDAALWRDTDCVTYVQADICRSDLNVEIEVSVFGVR